MHVDTLAQNLYHQGRSLNIFYSFVDPDKKKGRQNYKNKKLAATHRLRRVRPPQNQSRTNIFLKTSLCTDGSKHLHETNRINSCYTKSLRKFLWRIFFKYFYGFLEFLFMSANLVFGFSFRKTFL